MAESNETDAAAERIRELNEQILGFGRKTGLTFLEAYETMLRTFADQQDNAAERTEAEWIATIARAQANFARQVAGAYSAAARRLAE